jgi:hypothetical protein
MMTGSCATVTQRDGSLVGLILANPTGDEHPENTLDTSPDLETIEEEYHISNAIRAGCRGLRRSRYPFVGRGD